MLLKSIKAFPFIIPSFLLKYQGIIIVSQRLKVNDYYDEKMPLLEIKQRELDQCYLHSKFIDQLKERIPETYFVNAKMASETVDTKIIDELKQENKLATEYTKLVSSVLVNFKGQKYTLAQMSRFNHSADRKERRNACIATGKAMQKVGKKIDDIYAKMVEVRTEIAKKLGISRSYVSRIEKSALEKLKKQF